MIKEIKKGNSGVKVLFDDDDGGLQ